jgi:hypothetical protein
MTVHNFDSDFTVRDQVNQNIPLGLKEIPAVRQLSHAEGGRSGIAGVDIQTQPAYVEEFTYPGFWSLDYTMKQYWSGIRVPTKNSYRLMRVKIAGGDPSLLIWADDLKEGRARLPLAAISRESHGYNQEKFSPAYHSMNARYLSTRGDRVAKVYRPVPFLVDYKMTIWTERKRDAEYILQQVLTRFNPLAEFKMYDGKLSGSVQLRYNGCSDASDKEAGADQHANVRYELTMSAEAWLPLPEKIVPTVLGRVTSLAESSGAVLLTNLGSSVIN